MLCVAAPWQTDRAGAGLSVCFSAAGLAPCAAFDPKGTQQENGCAPSFVFCAKGGYARAHAAAQPQAARSETRSWSNPRNPPGANRAMQTAGLTSNLVQAASCPPLQKAQGRGTQNSGTGRKNTERAGHLPGHDQQYGTGSTYPPLQKAQGRGTQNSGTGRKARKERATRLRT